MKLYAVRVCVMDSWRACGSGGALELVERFRDDEIGRAEFDVGSAEFDVDRVPPANGDGDRLVGRCVGVSLADDDTDATCLRLTGSGVEFKSAPRPQIRGGVLAHGLDPDGNELTLLGES